jgi:hypothetical protein
VLAEARPPLLLLLLLELLLELLQLQMIHVLKLHIARHCTQKPTC